ncbi:MAG: TRAP transporter substrate-binding protein [Proteobacteria bacterium]|nr:TRAP transporter substrate-binding protein [Pseudomonadota bacterium]MDA1354812.1 TRAP transporter substrate-binding protein [Pseudomonadota bacterium]
MRYLITALAWASFAVLGAFGMSDSHAADDPIIIKFSHVVTENTPKGQGALKFKELAESRLAGRVEVQIFPNAQLYGDDKVLEALLLGDVQLAAPSVSKFSRYTDRLQLFDLPFLFADIAAVDRFQNSPAGRELLSATTARGLLGLGYWHNGMKQLSANTALKRPEDAAGLKFRIQASDVIAAQFQALDATPLKKPFSEVFILLQTKGIDGQENTWSNIYSKKFFEVQDYITETDHGVVDYMVVTSVEFWESLPDDVRTVLEQCIAEATTFTNQVALELAISDRAKIGDSGRSEILILSPTERQRWVDAMKPVWAEFEDDIGAEAIAAAMAANQ